MLFAMKQVKLKNGRTAVLRSAGHDDAQGLVDYMHLVYTQTEYLNRYPEEAIDYVVVHELCHLLQRNHSPAFYREVENILPDYRDRVRLLRGA